MSEKFVNQKNQAKSRNERIIISLLIILIVLVVAGIGIILFQGKNSHGNNEPEICEDSMTIQEWGIGNIVLGQTPLATFVSNEDALGDGNNEVRQWTNQFYDQSKAEAFLIGDGFVVTLYQSGNELCCLYSYNGTINEIIFYSPEFHTQEGVKVGMSLESLAKITHIKTVKIANLFTDSAIGGYLVKIPNSNLVAIIEGDWIIGNECSPINAYGHKESECCGGVEYQIPIEYFKGFNAHVGCLVLS